MVGRTGPSLARDDSRRRRAAWRGGTGMTTVYSKDGDNVRLCVEDWNLRLGRLGMSTTSLLSRKRTIGKTAPLRMPTPSVAQVEDLGPDRQTLLGKSAPNPPDTPDLCLTRGSDQERGLRNATEAVVNKRVSRESWPLLAPLFTTTSISPFEPILYIWPPERPMRLGTPRMSAAASRSASCTGFRQTPRQDSAFHSGKGRAAEK